MRQRPFDPAALLWTAALGVSAGLCLLCHQRLDGVALPAARPPQQAAAAPRQPSLAALRLLSLGFVEVAADAYFLLAIDHFGNKANHALNYPALPGYLQRCVGLDPYFTAAYEFAGMSLSLVGMDPEVLFALLEQGQRARPEAWRLAFLLGFNAWYLGGDSGRAARALATAARAPKAPPEVLNLATRMAASAAQPELGIELLQGLLDGCKAQSACALYAERQALLVLEARLRSAQDRLDAWRHTEGRMPPSPTELTAMGLGGEALVDPLGGMLHIDAQGRVHTDHTAQRLRMLAAPMQSPAPAPGERRAPCNDPS